MYREFLNFSNSDETVIILGDVKSDGAPDIANILFKFPVPHKKMRIRQEVRIDEIEIPGRSGKIKQATGYKDSEIEIQIELHDIEDRQGMIKSAKDQLSEIQKAFRSRDDKKLPRIFSISSPLTDKCEINNVLFKNLEVEDFPGNTNINVTITLIEFEPIAVQTEINRKRNQTISKTKKKAENLNQTRDGIDDEIGTEDPLVSAYRNGKKDAMGGLEP